MSIIAGRGDAASSMALLWAEPQAQRTGPGPKPGLSLDAIVAAAIAVADADTMTGLSMRTVADRLGRTSMALYTYVPGKAELLDLMYDRAHAELSTGHDPGRGWRAAVESWTAELRAFYLRHPWVLQVSYARPVLGPHEQQVLETLVGILDETGLPARTLRGIVSSLFHFVRGSAQTAAESRHAATATGSSDREWWSSRSAALNEVAPDFAERFPLSVRLAKEGASPREGESAPSWEHELEETFAVGLAVLLDGIEAAGKP
ncbi:TetR/AcrR family transcriptional regulator C-terminal domain-containing protein [Spirillospora sp. NBC_01491]|uniref:TetR/AcrR family transcriptional regulator C-terminal domain-containing protein n=1 Tax=Spirillospora sp. NBC_01491 TaxID=2976007 RepID=UPI002E37707E|nr:TetR/AcrR family transcriptional regulator C-terminal domain-containing protein [Spirillospora sp. NBC_01491]